MLAVYGLWRDHLLVSHTYPGDGMPSLHFITQISGSSCWPLVVDQSAQAECGLSRERV